MTKLFLIPAKKNSSGIKNKNLIKINGKNLVERTLSVCFSSKLTNLIYVSSDSRNILNIAKKNNAIPIKRPKKFCSNNSSANSVVLHFISVLPANLIRANPWVFYLQPTSPLRKKKHLIEACKLLKNTKAVTSVYETESNLFKGLYKSGKYLLPLVKENFLTENRQKLKKTFYPNGAIYIFKIKDFLKKNKIPIFRSVPYIMNRRDSLDIDSISDLRILKKLEK
jgi:CMP-N,N'-diacetyllegionaminic acid synthase